MGRSALIKPQMNQTYPMAVRGEGVYLYDDTGKDYLDASSGAVTVNIGHGVKEIVEAMKGQADKVSFVYRSQFTNEAAEDLALKLHDFTGFPYSFFVNSGSEATETTMKIAIQYWQEQGRPQKNRIIGRWMSYHGITMGALGISGHPLRRVRFESQLKHAPSVEPPYCYRCPFHMQYPACGLRCADDLESEINRYGKENIAAFICEPVVGAAGAAIHGPEGYLERVKEICEKNDILLIGDEVMTGLGRTGKALGFFHSTVIPDIVALGKGMSGGYTPIAAALVSEKVMQPIIDGSGIIMSGHTFSANPLSSAVSLAVINYIEKHGLVEKAESKGIVLKQKLMEAAKNHSFIGDLRGLGLLLGVELVKERKSKASFESEEKATDTMIRLAERNGLLLYPAMAGKGGMNGDAIIIAPPLTITEAEMDELITRLKKTFREFEEYISENKDGSDEA